MWGGIECSICRVGDDYSDQVNRSGHRTRLEDLDRIAELGIRKLRYPVLWEQVAPQSLNHPNWSWPDERLNRLRELNVDPIVGWYTTAAARATRLSTSIPSTQDWPGLRVW